MKQTKEQIDARKKFEKGIDIFGIIIAAITLITVILFFLYFGFIYNSDLIGTDDGPIEVRFSGFSALIALLTGNYDSADIIYQDIAVPFYYYAEDYVIILSILSTVAFFMLITAFVLQVLDVFFDKTALRYISSLLTLFSAFVLIACFIVALLMKDGNILHIYCSDNPSCSIKSYAIIPAITALTGAIAGLVHTVKKIS